MNFIKVGSACPVTKVADVDFNVENINLCIDEAYDKEVKYLVFPELAVTSYTCGDLFLNSALLNASIPPEAANIAGITESKYPAVGYANK